MHEQLCVTDEQIQRCKFINTIYFNIAKQTSVKRVKIYLLLLRKLPSLIIFQLKIYCHSLQWRRFLRLLFLVICLFKHKSIIKEVTMSYRKNELLPTVIKSTLYSRDETRYHGSHEVFLHKNLTVFIA